MIYFHVLMYKKNDLVIEIRLIKNDNTNPIYSCFLYYTILIDIYRSINLACGTFEHFVAKISKILID